MKKALLFLLAILALSACDWADPYPLNPNEFGEIDNAVSGSLVLKSASGFSSDIGTVYIQKGVQNWLIIKSRSGKTISEVKWTIAGQKYEGENIIFKTQTVGEIEVKVEVIFSNETKETSTFKIISVHDLSMADPVRVFVTSTSNSGAEVLFLFSKERISSATSEDFYVIGSATDWQKRLIPEADHNYIIKDGSPEKINDVGTHMGYKIVLPVGENSLALVYADEISDNIWANFSGSSFVKSEENPGLLVFHFNGQQVVPLGDNQPGLPGAVGDSYFRFTKNSDATVSIYFDLDVDYNADAFVVKRNDNGVYETLRSLSPVNEFDTWGTFNISFSEISGKVLYLRFGPDKDQKTVYSNSMQKSLFYDDFFKAIKVSGMEL